MITMITPSKQSEKVSLLAGKRVGNGNESGNKDGNESGNKDHGKEE
jgi:hypothetical protein